MTSHRQHHYVPAFLLREWESGSDVRLSYFRWLAGRFNNGRAKAQYVARQEHLYSVNQDSTQPDVSIERDFMGPIVDDPAGAVHKKILRGEIERLTDNEAEVWARFLVSLLLRLPSKIEHIRSAGAEVLRAAIAERPEEFDAIKGHRPERTLTEWVEKAMPSIFDDMGVMTLPTLIRSKKLNNAILAASWATFRASGATSEFLIADRPLIQIGPLSGNFLLCLPLSPTHLFMAYSHNHLVEIILSMRPERLVRETNASTMQNAVLAVFSSNDKLQRFVKNHLSRPNSPR
ncbi:DUF4238 domain-containing protein [Duganella sp. BuS-21]|uniref:DUF4238 domain-containing protein n=1 Tax=Duganella sp. BuS-21 TaxID=2943848 RepID=UPI0035A5B958